MPRIALLLVLCISACGGTVGTEDPVGMGSPVATGFVVWSVDAGPDEGAPYYGGGPANPPQLGGYSGHTPKVR